MLAEQARKAGILNFIVIGSYFEYGNSALDYWKIPTSAPLRPTQSYPTSKAAASVAFQGFAVQHGLKLKLLRLSQVFGPGEAESRFWPSLKRAASEGNDFQMSDGEQVRDFLPVEKAAQKIIEQLDFSEVVPGVPVVKNLTVGTEETLRHFAEFWWDHWGAKGKIEFGSIPYRQGEIMRMVPE